MAKQTGPKFFIGTIGMVCFYKRGSQYLMRMKSSLTSDVVKKSSCFANTRKSATELAIASRLASQVYRSLSKEKRNVVLYRKMTGIAKLMLKEGMDTHLIIVMLKHHAGNALVNPGLPVIDHQIVHRRSSIAHLSRWMVNKEGRLTPCGEHTLSQNIQLPERHEGKRYFKISNRSLTDIVDPVMDQTFLALLDFLGFRRARCPHYFKWLVKCWQVTPARKLQHRQHLKRVKNPSLLL